MRSLVDQIYESAFLPDLWEETLGDMAKELGAVSAAMLVIHPGLPPLWTATPNIHEMLGQFAQSTQWYDNRRLNRLRRKDHAGFLRLTDFSTHEELMADYPDPEMSRAHISAQAATLMALPDGASVLFTLERTTDMRPFGEAEIEQLDRVRRHLARASMMAVRLRLQKADASVTALAAIGLPAAVVTADGMVVAVNGLFESHAGFLRPAAFGRLSIANRRVNTLLSDALHKVASEARVQSIPVPSTDPDGLPAVVHVLPLRGDAREVFDSAAALIVVTSYSREGDIPPDAVLRGLFDLTAAEARLAALLSTGRTLAEVAAERGISVLTIRSQLAQVFRKTGTRQQSELVALLKGTHGYQG